MYKCWNCGTEHEIEASADAFYRGYVAAMEQAGLYVRLEHTDITLSVHHPAICKEQYCTVHRRSNHSMRKFPQQWRADRAIMERVCTHGIGHPDPDEYKLALDGYIDMHGCDGCCS